MFTTAWLAPCDDAWLTQRCGKSGEKGTGGLRSSAGAERHEQRRSAQRKGDSSALAARRVPATRVRTLEPQSKHSALLFFLSNACTRAVLLSVIVSGRFGGGTRARGEEERPGVDVRGTV